jgi:hypothetical protein
MLCDANCLPHIVQLLLTFDPIIVEKTAVLLQDIMASGARPFPHPSLLFSTFSAPARHQFSTCEGKGPRLGCWSVSLVGRGCGCGRNEFGESEF